MAVSKVSDPSSEIIDRYFRQWCLKTRKFSFLITGKTGVGKSSLVNALLGRKVAKEGRKKVDCTFEVTPYRVTIDGVDICVWDSPGLGDGTANDEKNLAEIGSKITEKLDLVIFCLKMDDQRFRRDDKDAFKILTENFGKKLWKNAVIALTFANKVKDPDGGDREAYFKQDLVDWQEEIHLFLSNNLFLDPELVQSLPLVPTGYYREPSVLPSGDHKKWLSKFWVACFKTARKPTAFSLYRINSARVRFPGSENLAAIWDGSEAAPTTPGLDDSEIPPIDLDEEHQESFWNTTWGAFNNYCASIGVVLGVIAIVGIAILKGTVRYRNRSVHLM